MNNIIIYSKDYCPYCKLAKALLTEKGLSYINIDVEDDSVKLEEMIKFSQRRTVPQIFIDGKHIGGSDDLQAYFANQETSNAA